MFFKKPPREWIHAHYTDDNGAMLKGKMHVALFIDCVYKLASAELRMYIRNAIDAIDEAEAKASHDQAVKEFDSLVGIKEGQAK